MVSALRIVAAGALLSASVSASVVQSSDAIVGRAHHRHHAHQRDAANDSVLVEKSEEADVVARSSSPKCGLGWASPTDSLIPYFVTAQTKYLYTWSPFCPAQAAEHGLECCPMLWGTKQIAEFQANKYKGGKCILGMNEVNVPSQGLLTVAAGAKLWNEYIRPMSAQGYYLVSPSVTSGDDGVLWLKEFFVQCGGNDYCNCNALAMHYYGKTLADFQKWANKFHAIFPGDIWVTEIACEDFGGVQCTASQIHTFMDEVITWISETPWIKTHFFFGLFWDMYNVNPLNRMVLQNGRPNALGEFYLNHS